MIRLSRILNQKQVGTANMTSQYSAESIEVLSGLEPVKRRPGMYTDTDRPNHSTRPLTTALMKPLLAMPRHRYHAV